jgi:glycosyltransferase involved in cell wall biosynthesis
MKICIVSWAPFHAGAEVAAERLAIGLQREGHEVLVVLGTKEETWRRMRHIGLHCEHVPLLLTDKWRMLRWRAMQQVMRQTFRRFRPDVVHCNDLPTSQMVGNAAKQLGIPRICHHRFSFGGAAIDWLNKFGAERHLFVSDAFMREMCAESKQLADAPRSVVHDGMPLGQAPTECDRRIAKDRLNLCQERVIVLFAGQVVEHKGLKDLIQAWQLMADPTRAKADLVIVGEDFQSQGDYRRKMQELAASIDCRARFVGFQSDVAAWQIAADIAVVPSHVEPLGLVVMEAMAQCLPVIGSDVGGIPEMIVNEETGLLVPPREPAALARAIERLIGNSAERERFGAAGRARCEAQFDIAVHTSAVLEQYRLVLPERACLAS